MGNWGAPIGVGVAGGDPLTVAAWKAMGRITAPRTATQKSQLGIYNSQGNQAFGGAQQALGQYNTNIGALTAGRNVGANPYLAAPYLRNVNQLQSQGMHAGAEAGKAALRSRPGLNQSGAPLTIGNNALQAGQLANTLGSQRAQRDYLANLQWQQYLAGSPLAGARINAGLYGTAAGGAENTLNNYTSAQSNVWNNLVSTNNAAMQAGAMAA